MSYINVETKEDGKIDITWNHPKVIKVWATLGQGVLKSDDNWYYSVNVLYNENGAEWRLHFTSTEPQEAFNKAENFLKTLPE